jgi:mycofactocin precursor
MKESDEKELDAEAGNKPEEASGDILEEIEVEDLTVDGICGVY